MTNGQLEPRPMRFVDLTRWPPTRAAAAEDEEHSAAAAAASGETGRQRIDLRALAEEVLDHGPSNVALYVAANARARRRSREVFIS
jgi:hypothetical protein